MKAKLEGGRVRGDWLTTVSDSLKRKGVVVMIGPVLLGLVLARLLIISKIAGLLTLAGAAAVVLGVFLRKVDYLIFGWLILTSFVWLIAYRYLSPQYQSYFGQGVFWGLLACAMIGWLTDSIFSKRTFLPVDNMPIKVTIFFFIGWASLSLFTTSNLLISAKTLAKIIIALATSYMFYNFFSRDLNNIRRFLLILSLVIIVVSSAAIVSACHALVSGTPIYKKIGLWFWNPNVLGSLLFVCAPLLIISGFDFTHFRRIRFLFVFMLLTALYFSFHRTSWLAASISFSFLLWKGRARMAMGTAIVVTLFLLGLLLPVVGSPIYDFFRGEQYSGRREIWQASWKSALENPMLGIGIGNSAGSMDRYIDTPWIKRQETHDVFLQNAVEMGFLSPAIVLVFYIVFLRFCERTRANLQSPYLRSIVEATTATFLGLFVHGIFGNYGILNGFSAGEFYVLLPYILLALPFAARRLDERAFGH